MVKIVKYILWSMLLWGTLHAEDSFERHCVACHQKLPATLQEMFKRYLLIYSSENNVKAGIKHYLRYPSKDISAMSTLFIDSYGIKEKTKLSSKELDEAIDIYWEKYKVFGKLR